MQKMNADEIRESYLKFFESKQHLRLPSFSLVPVDDPTLLIIGAGMAPLKPYFKGEAIPPNKRITTCQKCVRVGDIEQVGKTARHDTFFEMLGNFSFGDYFKKESIKWAWEYLVDVLGLPGDKLYVTIHSDDDEAEKLWIEEVNFPKDRIYRLPDNFWGPIGTTGPCGPCSEIVIDQGEELSCKSPDCAPGCDCDRYLEIWNLVFTGLNKNESGEYEKLPKPCIDTGLGFERLVAYMHEKKNIFETELFEDIIAKITEISGKKLGTNEKDDIAIKVIADHIRSFVFMSCDGITPSNEGRGYVLRRLVRRSTRKAQDLGFNNHSLTDLVDSIIKKYGHVYPELVERKQYITRILAVEEENFRKTLNQGMHILEAKLAELEKSGGKTLSGKDMFTLYDTYGFPAELTEEITAERGFNVDQAGFAKSLEEQRERARTDTKSKLSSLTEELDFTTYKSQFTGYETFEEQTSVQALFHHGKEVTTLKEGQEGEAVFTRTCFYGESGGQVGDSGVFHTVGCSGVILDTRSTPAKVNLHHLRVERGTLNAGETITIIVDKEKRRAVKRHHTATHLLQSALREVIGGHVAQMGSLVDENKLRFDFSHHQAVTRIEIEQIETHVNKWILDNKIVEIKELPVNEALKSGALAFFGEKYGDTVRVISVPDVSMELCGGTHVGRTGDIGSFKIISEGAVAMGTRRIEAICGLVSLERFQLEDALLRKTGEMLTSDINNVPQAVEKIMSNIRSLEKELKNTRFELLKASVDTMFKDAVKVEDTTVIVKNIPNLNRDDLRNLSDLLAAKGNAIVVLGTIIDGKVAAVVRISEEPAKRGYSAVPIAQELSRVVEGSGGGKPRFAQAGGRNTEKLDEALKKAFDVIEKILKK